jgi:hypothetical protein
MENRYEKYLPNATHVFAYVPGSNRTKRPGSYRIFKNSGTWGDNGTTLRVPLKQLHAGTFVSQRGMSNYRTKIPRKNGITGKEANLIPVGGSVVRVIGSEKSEFPGAFGFVPDNGGGYGLLKDITNITNEAMTEAYRKDMGLDKAAPNQAADTSVLRRYPIGQLSTADALDELRTELTRMYDFKTPIDDSPTPKATDYYSTLTTPRPPDTPGYYTAPTTPVISAPPTPMLTPPSSSDSSPHSSRRPSRAELDGIPIDPSNTTFQPAGRRWMGWPE